MPTTPEPELIETIAVGKIAVLGTADVAVAAVEQVDSFPTHCGGDCSAPDGRSLTAVTITYTNTGDDLDYTDGRYWGDDMVTFRDSDVRELQ